MADAHPCRVLLACIDSGRSGPLATAFADCGDRTTLVTDPEDLGSCLDDTEFDLLAAPCTAITHHREAFERCLCHPECAVLILGDDDAITGIDEIVHASIPDDADPRATVIAAHVLMEQRDDHAHAHTRRWGALRLEPEQRAAWLDDEPLPLTRLEFRILQALIDARGALVSRSDLEHRVWGCDSVDVGQRIMAHVRRIRRKIEADPRHPQLLLTVRGEGFRLTQDVPPSPARSTRAGRAATTRNARTRQATACATPKRKPRRPRG